MSTLEVAIFYTLIVVDDADLDAAVSAAAFSSFASSGQICMSTERIIVDKSIGDSFVEKFAAKTQKLPMGNPRKGPVVLGSVVDIATFDRCNALIEDAVSKGGYADLRGCSQDNAFPGHYHYP